MSYLDDIKGYRKFKSKCPVCNNENTEISLTEDGMSIEDYYYCDNCQYISVMCYSPYMCGVPENYNKRYKSDVLAGEIPVLSFDDYNHLFNMLPTM